MKATFSAKPASHDDNNSDENPELKTMLMAHNKNVISDQAAPYLTIGQCSGLSKITPKLHGSPN